MTGAQILDAILADAFETGRRAEALTWAQYRHALLWDAEPWTFTVTSASISVTANTQAVSNEPADLGVAIAVYDADGKPLRPVADFRDFSLNATSPPTGAAPSAFTSVGSSLFIGPEAPGTTKTYLLVYEKTLTALADNSGTTGLPAGYDLAIVYGAKADGYRLANAERAAMLETEFANALQIMRRKWSRAVAGAGEQPAAYRAGG